MSEHTTLQQARTSLERRNQELLQFQDAALMLALRLSGNVPDAEDILQDAYVKAVNASEPLVFGNDLRNWFLHVTANVARDRFRSEQRRRTRERSAAMDAKSASTVEVPQGDDADVRKLVDAELSRLDEKLRAPIALHYEQGLSYEEASFVLGVPAPTLRVYASRGIEELRQRLAAAGRPVVAEVLVGALATGFAVKTSPALAASISSIVNGSAGALSAAGAAKAPLFVQKAAGLSTLVKAAIIAIICGASLGLTFVAGYWLAWNKDASPPVSNANNLIVANAEQAADPPAAPVQAQPPKVEAAAPKIEEAVPLPVDWAGAVNLLPMIDPARDAVVGNWRFEGPSLIGEPQPFGRIMAPYEVPHEYDLRVEFTRRSGEMHPQFGAPTIAILFSHKGKSYILRIDAMSAWNTGYYSDFIKPQQHPDAKPAPMVTNGVRYACTILVREESVQAYLDGALLRSVNFVKTPIPETPANWNLRDFRCIGFGSHAAQVEFHSVALRAVTGKGNPVVADVDAPRIASEEYWKDALDLIAQPLSQENAIGGKWTLGDGPVSVKNLPEPADVCPRIQFNVIPPEEYDFRIEFTRDAGRFDVAQILSAYGRSFVWKMGIDGGLCLLDRVGGVPVRPMQNPRAVRVPEIKPGERHISVVCIRRDHVSCFLDGRLIATLKTDYSDLDIEQNWKLPSPRGIGVGVTEANATFHKAQVKAVTGTVMPLKVTGGEK